MHDSRPEMANNLHRGSRLHQLRMANNYTQQFVADSLGVAASTLSRWEQDQDKMHIEDLRKAAEFYHVSTEWLMSPDPVVLHVHDNKAENGAGAYNTVNVMPQEAWDRLDKLINESTRMNEEFLRLNQRLLALVEALSTKLS